ncbi:hypothetical protein G6F70_001662 [Rhizopus microsporus]|uniref:NAD-dependent epimerase/dehydratase domain-containing protein n=2 Tax=Rhizopus TaxID=4842 RepID=A0A367K9Z9_RHIAZ|nr:hypothetical protein G6F71_000156 [Rhizopus microsporus]RCH99063.1 hypothetical protein CU097_009586 [Rhizopus azygosporus]KAG1203112.1 hypothetical protein G6F70_001662 [Rhizopus microsporus]KAG1215000.1 hypothetical protein G6F69_001401 [Rhizopus microsporus]KAG1238425.1 hypothetical protein G6F67_000409 [Rhizopus microsporus]
MSIARKVLVVGGTGFLGLDVCKLAVQKGWETVSLSRKGEPTAFQQRGRPAWAEKVQWTSGNSLEPESYKEVLSGVTDVVHSVGILLENDYKGIAQAKSLCEVAGKLPGLLLNDKGNPLDPKLEHKVRPTYEMMNRDTAITVANQVEKLPSIKSFVFISASQVMPFIDPRYYTTKREAESYLFKIDKFKTVVLRPGLMYNSNRPTVAPLVGALKLANAITSPFKKEIGSLPGGKSITTAPLNTEQVARAIIASIELEEHGIFDVDGIQQLSNKCI